MFKNPEASGTKGLLPSWQLQAGESLAPQTSWHRTVQAPQGLTSGIESSWAAAHCD